MIRQSVNLSSRGKKACVWDKNTYVLLLVAQYGTVNG